MSAGARPERQRCDYHRRLPVTYALPFATARRERRDPRLHADHHGGEGCCVQLVWPLRSGAAGHQAAALPGSKRGAGTARARICGGVRAVKLPRRGRAQDRARRNRLRRRHTGACARKARAKRLRRDEQHRWRLPSNLMTAIRQDRGYVCGAHTCIRVQGTHLLSRAQHIPVFACRLHACICAQGEYQSLRAWCIIAFARSILTCMLQVSTSPS
mmetsp:Transcript_170/g.298  ORF Transcript_170/g.298 Transcript_170/m.298 type:complete len:214 (-) Transcript_170:289-930(-)